VLQLGLLEQGIGITTWQLGLISVKPSSYSVYHRLSPINTVLHNENDDAEHFGAQDGGTVRKSAVHRLVTIDGNVRNNGQMGSVRIICKLFLIPLCAS
jgi:hypothetical protein